jgi:hypothetical protein
MPLVIDGGDAPAAAGGTTAYGTTTYNVADYGAVADGTTDSTAAIQAAIDAAGAASVADDAVNPGAGPRRIVFLPGGNKPYLISAPLKIRSKRVCLRGDGVGLTQLKATGSFAGDMIWIGMELGSILPDATPYRVDATSILDGTTGQRYGYDFQAVSGKPSYLSFSTCQLASGAGSAAGTYLHDRWSETKVMTVSFIAYIPANTHASPVTRNIVGIGNGSLPAPWYVQTYGSVYVDGWLRLVVQLADGTRPQLLFDTGHSGAAGVYRIHVVWDTTTQEYGAAVMGPGDSVYTWRATGGISLPVSAVAMQGSVWEPLVVNAEGPTPPYGDNSPSGGPGPFKIYGLKIDKAATFTPGTTGTTATRVDGHPANDAYNFFVDGASTIGFLPLQDPPADNRVVTAQNGSAGVPNTFGTGYLATAFEHDNLIYNSIADMEIICGFGGGAGVVAGRLLYLDASRLYIWQGFQGFSVHPTAANFTVRLDDLNLSGNDAGLSCHMTGLRATRLRFPFGGRVTIQLAGCDANIRDVWIDAPAANTQAFLQATSVSYAQRTIVDGFIVDGEEGTPVGLAAFDLAIVAGVGIATIADFRNVVMTPLGGSVPCFNLHSGGSTPPALARLTVKDFQQAGGHGWSAAVQVDGANNGWYGTVDGWALVDQNVVNTTQYGSSVNVTVTTTP